MPSPIDPPTLALLPDQLVDWLELTALFDPFKIARTDALLGSLLELQETAEDDIGQRDQAREQLIEAIENEIELRRKHLEDTYPFRLSDTAEELALVDDWEDERFTFYLVCLVTAHVTGSSILGKPPTGELLTRLRNSIFQVIATLGMAGLAAGPALSVGWPRRSGQTIIELMTRAATLGAGFTARNPAGIYTSPQEKDGGVDVIAWTMGGQPPPTAFFFAQTASGQNWPGKPVTAHALVFGGAYMQDHMTGNILHATIIPFRVVDDAFWHSQHKLHMAILDRLRLPKRAWEGALLAARGVTVDGYDQIGEVRGWLAEYQEYAQAA